jgi:hypothetical protein
MQALPELKQTFMLILLPFGRDAPHDFTWRKKSMMIFYFLFFIFYFFFFLFSVINTTPKLNSNKGVWPPSSYMSKFSLKCYFRPSSHDIDHQFLNQSLLKIKKESRWASKQPSEIGIIKV